METTLQEINMIHLQSGLYLNCSAWFMKNIDYMACLKMQKISLLPTYMKCISRGVLLDVFTYVNEGCLKVNRHGL